MFHRHSDPNEKYPQTTTALPTQVKDLRCNYLNCQTLGRKIDKALPLMSIGEFLLNQFHKIALFMRLETLSKVTICLIRRI